MNIALKIIALVVGILFSIYIVQVFGQTVGWW